MRFAPRGKSPSSPTGEKGILVQQIKNRENLRGMGIKTSTVRDLPPSGAGGKERSFRCRLRSKKKKEKGVASGERKKRKNVGEEDP